MKLPLHKHKKKEPKAAKAQPEGSDIIEGVAGPALGKIYTISSEPVSVHDRFSIEKRFDRIIARSLTEKELYISGEFVHEAILSEGDMIVTQDSEFRYRFKLANEEEANRKKQNLTRAAMVLLLLFIILPVIAPKIIPWPALFTRAEVKNIMIEGEHAFDIDQPKELAFGEDPSTTTESSKKSTDSDKKITDPAEVSRIIAMARMRYEVANSYAQQGELFAGHLFWAIQELKAIADDLEKVSPEPELLPIVKQQAKQYQSALEAHQKHLHVQAIIASRLGEEKRYTELIKEIEYISQYQGSSAFEWAAKALKDAKSN